MHPLGDYFKTEDDYYVIEGFETVSYGLVIDKWVEGDNKPKEVKTDEVTEMNWMASKQAKADFNFWSPIK